MAVKSWLPYPNSGYLKSLTTCESNFLGLSSMEAFQKTTFPIFSANPNLLSTKPIKPFKVAVKPPPSDFDFRTEILSDSKATIAKTCPDLLNLADNGTLVLIQKRQFGPVPAWRSEFVEPENIWLIGTTHLSQDSATDVERVVRAIKPDNVVVELCRSRQACFPYLFLLTFILG